MALMAMGAAMTMRVVAAIVAMGGNGGDYGAGGDGDDGRPRTTTGGEERPEEPEWRPGKRATRP